MWRVRQLVLMGRSNHPRAVDATNARMVTTSVQCGGRVVAVLSQVRDERDSGTLLCLVAHERPQRLTTIPRLTSQSCRARDTR